MNIEHVGAYVLIARRARGWSQSDLAERAQVSRNTISNIERGNRNVTVSTLARVIAAFGLFLHIGVVPVDDKTASKSTPADDDDDSPDAVRIG